MSRAAGGKSTSRSESRRKGLLRSLLDGAAGRGAGAAGDLLVAEAAELEAISEALFRKIESRIKSLEAIEARLDEKSRELERLITRAERAAQRPEPDASSRRTEILALFERGLKIDEIAALLDIPRGEAELVLNLEGRRTPSR